SVGCSYCDKNGNLWFGTFGGGVSRYDGKSFTNYTTSQGLVDDQLFSIFQDKVGNMWFGTWNGATRYDGKIIKKYTQDSICCIIYCIYQDKKGDIWFGTGNGVSRFDGTSFKHYSSADGIAANSVYCILQDKDENIWFGTENG